MPDVKVARAAQEAGIAGLAFLRGIPGGIGGAAFLVLGLSRRIAGAALGEVDGGGAELRAGDRIVTITAQPGLQANASAWRGARRCPK